MKSTAQPKSVCPNCGGPLPQGALAGLCPACLLAQGAETEADFRIPKTGFAAPSIEEVAKLFPQLEIQLLLGAGGMGAVYKARQPVLDRMVALKVLPTADTGGVHFAERFNREARALARLNHPNIVAVHEFGQAGNLHYFIMEFVDGANLRQLERAGRLSPREALQIIPQICEALQYAHDEGVVHRDIKPENVLVDRKGRIKIADFGLAKILGYEPEASRLTMDGQVMGTPHYMAPEQVERPLAVDHRADIYSLGVVFYEMLTGDLPLGKFPPPSRKVQVDVRLDEVVLRTLENDPSRRYQHASEVKSQVEEIVAHPELSQLSAAGQSGQTFMRWAGFPVVRGDEQRRSLHWKGIAQAFAVVFAVLTLGFGIVSLSAGRSLMGWLGVVGWGSVVARLLIAGLIIGWGVYRAFRRPLLPARTVIVGKLFQPERLSRKAVLGLCWVPIFLLALVLHFTAGPSRPLGDVTNLPEEGMRWWQIALVVILLPLGVTAPFGTTILGWLAARDIRREKGRLGGLPLAIFDGLFFPLLLLNAVISWLVVEILPRSNVELSASGATLTLLAPLAIATCVAVDVIISRVVWNRARLDRVGAQPSQWWWASPRGGVVLGTLCVAVITLTANRRDPGSSFNSPSQQIAEKESHTGRLVAELPIRGKVEMLAVSERDAAPNAWWSPDGTAIPDTLYEVANGVQGIVGPKVRTLLVRWQDLPKGGAQTSFQIKPFRGGSAGGGSILRDGKELPGAWRIQAGFPEDARTASLRIGFGLEPWKTMSTHSPNGSSTSYSHLSGMPKLQPRIHQMSENGGQAVVTLVMERESEDWSVRVIAIDTNGQEHTQTSGAGTPIEKTSIWTYTFHQLPLARVKEFQVQLRPVHWVEFRDVALEPKDRALVGKSSKPFRPTHFGSAQQLSVEGVYDLDTGSREVGPRVANGPKEWMLQEGFDLFAKAGQLALGQVEIVDLSSAEWDSLSPQELSERLRTSRYGPRFLPSTPGAKFPVTYGFQTRQGGMGVLQILALNPNEPNVQLQFKLIERAHFE